MENKRTCIIVKDKRTVRLSEIVNDCVSPLCVSTTKGESLVSILKKICTLAQNGSSSPIPSQVFLEAGNDIVIDGDGSESAPYRISSTFDAFSVDGRIRFIIGDAGYPGGGYTEYTPMIDGTPVLIDKGFKLYREGEFQWDGDVENGYTFNNSTGKITFYPPLNTGEHITILVTQYTTLIPDPLDDVTTSSTSTTTTHSTTTTTTQAPTTTTTSTTHTSTSTTTTTTAASTTTTTTPHTITSTTTTTSSTPVTVYWGWKNSITSFANSGAMISAANGSGSFTHNSTISANYTSNPDPKFLWMAEPIGETAKTKWDGDGAGTLNQGDIGGTSGVTDNLFASPSTLSGTYRFYITEYETQNTTNPIEFKIS